MPNYFLCVALRCSDGIIDKPVREEIIAAGNRSDAVAAAKEIRVDLIGLDANLIYLTDAAGHLIWSLRLNDVWP